MIIFSEGVPRSGKSYDGVKSHILPALKKGRRVYARLNGLDHEKIAAYLGITVEECRERLVLVESADVKQLFVAHTGTDGQWTLDEKFRNALIVIDEVHEFYVGGGKEQLPPAVEQFFALHGHYGIDILLLTQFYKRLHLAIRARIERKASFQKLSVFGKVGESSYRVTYWQTLAPDRYEKVGGQTKKYDDKIFPLYSGYAAGDVDAAVYDEGRINALRPIMVRALFVVPIALFGIYFLYNFFAGDGGGLIKDEKKPAAPVVVVDAPLPPNAPAVPVPVAATQPIAQSALDSINSAGPPGVAPPGNVLPIIEEFAEMTPEQKFIFKLSSSSRIRYGGTIYGRYRDIDLVEWYDSRGEIVERMYADQVRALGIDVKRAVYGLRISVGEDVLVATQWPMVANVRESSHRLYNTSPSGTAGVSEQGESTPSVPESRSDAANNSSLGFGTIAAYGDIVVAPPGTNSSDIE